MILATIILCICMYLYFKIADKYNIIDKPNERSSHNEIIIRGAGIIFPIACLLYFFQSNFYYPYFIAGVVLISLISFFDDIKTTKNSIRFIVQFVCVLLLFYQTNFLNNCHYSILIVALIFAIGILNAWNFMDGINGITGLYSIATIATLLFINLYTTPFIETELLLVTIIALLIFNFCNTRKKALCFAGDVGSISIAFIIIFALASLILKTNHLEYILLLAVYGVDSALTIAFRLINKENIFKAHRSHLYQWLVHKQKMSHLKVSFIYFLIQLAVNLILMQFILQSENSIYQSIIILILLGLIYIALKQKLKNQHQEC